MSLIRNYNRLRNVSSKVPNGETDSEKAIAASYKSNLNITTSNINTAHNLVTDAYKPLVFIKDKFNDLMDYVTTVQNHWFTWISDIAIRLGRIGTVDATTHRPLVYDSTKTYNVGDMVLYTIGSVQYQYMCINNNITGTWDSTKWKMITPSGLGLTFGTDVEISASNGKVQIVDKTTPTTVYATMLSDLAYLTSDSDAIDGMVYLLDIDT